MLSWIIAFFIGLPIAELVLLLKVGQLIGFWRTVAVIVVTAVVGASMWRSQGMRILWRIQDELRREEVPADSMIEGLMILVGGAFLLTPGFLTDFFGFLFLIPVTRRFLKDYLKRWIKRKVERGEIEVYFHSSGSSGDDPSDDFDNGLSP